MIAGFSPRANLGEQFRLPLRTISRVALLTTFLGGTMRGPRVLSVSAIILIALSATLASARPAADDHGTIVITFKDGHRQSLAVAEIARLDFKSPSVIIYRDGHHEKINADDIARIDFDAPDATATLPGRAHFLGKWE